MKYFFLALIAIVLLCNTTDTIAYYKNPCCTIQTIYEFAQSPDGEYYADFPKDSFEYWNHYCNSFINTNFACK